MAKTFPKTIYVATEGDDLYAYKNANDLSTDSRGEKEIIGVYELKQRAVVQSTIVPFKGKK